MKKNLVFACALLLSVAALAAGEHEVAEGHGEAGIPFDKIGWQAANLGILLVIIFFAVKKSIVDIFAKRQQDFLAQAEKTKSALKGAEAALEEVKSKLNQLESGETKSIEAARKEASLMMANMVKEAEHQSERIKAEAQNVIKTELDKAKTEISTTILSGAIASATQKVVDQSAQTTKDSEGHFLKQISGASL